MLKVNATRKLVTDSTPMGVGLALLEACSEIQSLRRALRSATGMAHDGVRAWLDLNPSDAEEFAQNFEDIASWIKLLPKEMLKPPKDEKKTEVVGYVGGKAAHGSPLKEAAIERLKGMEDS